MKTPSTWTFKSLGTLLERITYGFTNPMPGSESGPHLVTARDIHDGQIDYSTARHTSKRAYEEFLTDKSRPKVGDLLLTKDGSIGRLAVCDREDVCINQSVALLQPKPGTNTTFLRYLLTTNAYQQKMAADSSGSTIKHIYITRVDKMSILLPPVAEQQAIAEVLGALDDKITANRKLVATIDDLLVALVTDLDCGATLSDLASLHKVAVQPASMPAAVNHYSLPNFDEGALPSLELSSTIKSGKFVVDRPVVLLSKLNPQFSRVWNVPTPEPDAVASSEFLVLEPKVISTATLWALLSTPPASRYLQEHVSGTTGSHQRFQPVQAMAMPMPVSIAPALQDALTSLGDRAVSARYESQTLAQLRDTLLPALMDGTIRVKDAEKQAEEAL